MARKARQKSNSGIYHVLIRASADVCLFGDEEDHSTYLQAIREFTAKGFCQVYAYALFPTHVHLLISEKDENIGQIMKRLANNYSYYYNVKYDHFGPIYLDRFKSEPVETEAYFTRVLNFIETQETEARGVISLDVPSVLSSLPASDTPDPKVILDYVNRPLRITDSRLLDYLRQSWGFLNITEFLQRTVEDRKQLIIGAKSQGGSVRQIMRLTGSPMQFVFETK